MKKWSKRFINKGKNYLYSYTSSILYDNFLYKYEIINNFIHARLLLKIRILNIYEFNIINKSIQYIILNKNFREGLEDIHFNFENKLIKYTNGIGNKIRTSRSRNDLVNTDLKLWIFDRIKAIIYNIVKMLKRMLKISKKNFSKVFIGFTHFQVAQAITFGHYILSYYNMFIRDLERFINIINNNNICPLGSCALSGTSFKIDNNYCSKKLFFKNNNNSMDGVSDRDYLLDFIYCCSIIMIHISRFSEDIINYSSNLLGIIYIRDDICTGSSIMPQKKNPDIYEVMRSRSGKLVGNLTSLIFVLKAQTMAYNKDNQEDKELAKSSYVTVLNTLKIFSTILSKIKVRSHQCKKILFDNFCTATDIADFLTKNSVPFKKSHSIVSYIVSFCITEKINLNKINMKVLKKKKKNIYYYLKRRKIKFPYISIEDSIKSKISLGGTSPKRLKKNIINLKLKLNEKIVVLKKMFK
ncbi:argininosuccinate lyase [Candidatus Vidania fulgoroideorum]